MENASQPVLLEITTIKLLGVAKDVPQAAPRVMDQEKHSAVVVYHPSSKKWLTLGPSRESA